MGFFDSATNLLTGGSEAAAGAGLNKLTAGQDFLSNIYNTTATQEQPFIQTGQNANSTLSNILLGGDTSAMQPFFNSSTYQFPLQQGLQQISNNNAAKGLSNSTAALRNAGQYTEGLASQGFQQFISNLMGLNTSGQQGIATQAQTGVGIAAPYANLTTGAADAAGAKAAAPWQALDSSISGAASLGNSMQGGSSFLSSLLPLLMAA